MSGFQQLREAVAQRKEDKDTDAGYFDRLCNSLVCYTDSIQYNGRIKRLYFDNPYTTILNESRWSSKRARNFERYVYDKYGNPDKFNEWVRKNKSSLREVSTQVVSFINDPNFNIIFMVVNQSYLNAYCLINPDNKQVKYLCSSKNPRFYYEVINYLREIKHMPSLVNLTDDYKVVQSLRREVNLGHHIVHHDICLMSNDANEYCFAYIPLDTYRRGNIASWLHFLDQFDSEYHRDVFCAWIYSLFVAKDINRQVLWVEGVAMTGKSTVFNVVADFLGSFSRSLVKSIAEDRFTDKFSLEGFEMARLAIFADANEEFFFKRREILNMTGNDIVSINRKGQAAISHRLNVKVVVYSNFPPKINENLAHERTRLIHLKLESPNMKKYKEKIPFKEGLKSQFPQFLAYCKDKYFEVADINGFIGGFYDKR